MAADLAPDWPSGSRDGVYRIVIDGEPLITCEMTKGTVETASADGILATAMWVVNVFPFVVEAPAGLVSSLDLAPHPPPQPLCRNGGTVAGLSRSAVRLAIGSAVMDLDVAEIRARLDHPVVDGDGHIVESLPARRRLHPPRSRATMSPIASPASSPAYAARHVALLARCRHRHRPRAGHPITPWWALPTDALDRATGFLPELLYERLDEIGIDFTVLYSSVGLACIGHADEAIRRARAAGSTPTSPRCSTASATA